MANDIQLHIEPVLDLDNLSSEGKKAGQEITAAINSNSKDAGKNYETNIKKALNLYRQFQKQLVRLNNAEFKPNAAVAKLSSDLAVMKTQLTDATQAYQNMRAQYLEMEDTWKKETASHKKLTYLKKDVEAARQSMIALGKDVGQRQVQLQQLEDMMAAQSWGDKYNFDDQTTTNQVRMQTLTDTIQDMARAYNAANRAKKEFTNKQSSKDIKYEYENAQKREEAYIKTNVARQKYIDKAREENATSRQVADAISQVTERLVELESSQDVLRPDDVNRQALEYGRLISILNELRDKYSAVRAAEDQAYAQSVADKKQADYAKVTSALQKYIDKAREESATLNDVQRAISQVVSRMVELEMFQGPLTTEQITEYERLSNTLEGLKNKYAQLQQAQQQAQQQADFNTSVADAKKKIDEVSASISRLIKRLARLSSHAIKNAFTGIRRSITGMGKDSNDTSKEIQSLIRNIVKYGFGVRSIYFLYRRLRTALVDALKDMAKVDTTGLGASLTQLASSLQYLKSAWAAAFAPIIEYVTPVLVQLMDLLANVANAIAALFATLTGKGTVVRAVKQQKSLADALGNTGSAAKDAAGKLADFDELNIIGNDSNGGGGGGSGSGDLPDGAFITETIENELADLINADKWFEIGQLFADRLNTLTEAADKWINDVFRPWGVRWATNLGNFLNGFIYHYNWELLGKTFADGINAIFDTANTWFTTVNWSWFGARVADGLISAIETIDWALIGQTLANRLNKTIDFLYGFVKNLFIGGRAKQIADAIADGVYNFFMTIHWDNLFSTLSTGFNGIFRSLQRFIEQYDWDTVGTTIANALNTSIQNLDAKEAGKTLSTFVLKVFDQLKKIDLFAVGQKIGEFLASINWPDIIGAAISNIFELVSGIISGAFNGEYGMSIASIIVGALAVKLGLAFAKFKIAELIGGAMLKGALSSAGIGAVTKGVEGAATGASGLLSGISAGPILGVVAALGGFIVMCKQSVDWLQEYKAKLGVLDEETQKHIDQLDVLIEQTNGYHDASVRQMGVYDVENERIRTLADSYLALFDENGKVKEGMQARADYYYGQLATALGLEQDQLTTLIQNHGDLKTAIDEVITAKTQDRAVSAYLDEYQFALDHVKEAQDAVTLAEQDHQAALEHRKETQLLVDKAQQDYISHLGQGVEVEAEYKKKLDDAITANSNAEYAVSKTTEQITKANDELLKINATADFYEGYIAAIATKDTNLINAALKRMQDGFITAEEGDRESLLRQANNMEEYYGLLLQEMEKGNPNVTQEMLDNAREWTETARKELRRLDDIGSEAMDDLKAGMKSKKSELVTEAENTSKTIASAYQTSLTGVLNGVNMGTPTANLPVYSYAASGGGTLSPQRTSFAKLASGAVLPPNDPFLAIVGDQKRGTNIEAPLTTIEDAVRNVVGDSNYNPEVVSLLQELIEVVRTKNLSLSRKEVASAVVKEINNERMRTGNTPILG